MLSGAFTAGCVQAQGVSYSGSLQYATGSYFFEETTESISFLNGFGWSGETFSVSFSVPFIYQNSPWISYGAAGYIPTGGPQHKAVRDSSRKGRGDGNGNGDGRRNMMNSVNEGNYYIQESQEDIPLPDTSSYSQSSLGDPSIYANFKLYTSEAKSTTIRLNSGLKLPFADPNSGFGTGEWDFGLGLSVSQRIQKFFLIADAMKWWFGDLPDLELKDPLAYSFGVGRSLAGGDWLINASLTGYTEIIEDFDPPINLGFGLGYFVSDRVSLNSTISFGLSESSSDYSVGLGWNIKL